MIRRKLRAPKHGIDEVALPKLEQEMRELAEVGPNSTHRPTRRWVAKMNREIDILTLPCLSAGELEQCTYRNETVLAHAIKKMRKVIAAGPDRIAAPQIKEAPRAFHKLLAFFTAWAAELGVFLGISGKPDSSSFPRRRKGKSGASVLKT